MSESLEIRNLWASVAEKPILKGVNLKVEKGAIHALMGPNGAGKSTLGKIIAGDPNYQIEQGQILLDGQDISELAVDERARAGLFMAFQYPVEVPGVSLTNFLRLALQARTGGEVKVRDFWAKLQEAVKVLEWDPAYLNRYLNEGFSGGEKKRAEVLQLMVLAPKYAILDETDSGLDIDALKVVAKGVNSIRSPDFGALVITHYQRLLQYIVPDRVHVMVEGQIVTEGGPELALELESRGYEWVRELAAR